MRCEADAVLVARPVSADAHCSCHVYEGAELDVRALAREHQRRQGSNMRRGGIEVHVGRAQRVGKVAMGETQVVFVDAMADFGGHTKERGTSWAVGGWNP